MVSYLYYLRIVAVRRKDAKASLLKGPLIEQFGDCSAAYFLVFSVFDLTEVVHFVKLKMDLIKREVRIVSQHSFYDLCPLLAEHFLSWK